MVCQMMSKSAVKSRWGKKQETGLHLLLVAAVLVYLFSPLLDHWLGNDAFARPHTHIYLSENHLPSQFRHAEDTADGHAINDEHAEFILCLLDINAFLAIALINTGLANSLVEKNILVFGLPLPYLPTETISLSSLDPPPQF